jgi:tetratricopeptide (TPR) repeat protein
VTVVVLAALAVFSPSLGHDFVWDDRLLILPVEAYWSADLASIFFSKVNSLEYLPLRDLSLAVDAAVWGRSPFGFHLTNLLLYLATLPLVYSVVRRLAEMTDHDDPQHLAFWTTLIFAVHPLHAEPVNFVAARNNLMAMLFVMLSLYAFLSPSPRRALMLSCSLLAFGFALLSKASVVFFPLALLLIYWLVPRVRRAPQVTAVWLVAFLLVDLLAVWGHLANAGDTGMIVPGMDRFGVANRWFAAITALQIPWFYVGKALWPQPLSVLYPAPGTGHSLYGLIAGLGLLLVVVLCWRLRERARLLVFAVGWLLLSLGPVLNLVPTHPVVADRYVYPGSLGLALAAALGLAAAVRRWPSIIYVAWLTVLIWCASSFGRSMDWRSDVSLFEAAYAAYPDEASSHYIGALMASNRDDEALRIDPKAGAAYSLSYTRGLAAERAGRFDEALEHFAKALRAGGEADQGVLSSAARAYERSGNPMAAIHYYLRVIETTTPDPLGEYRRRAALGLERVRRSQANEAQALIARASAHPTGFAEQFEAGLFLHRLGDYGAALLHYRRAASLQPERWEVWYNIGLVQTKRGARLEAIAAHQRVLALNPGHLQTLTHLGINSAAEGDYEGAARYYQRALSVDPGFVDAAFNLGRLHYRRGDREQARRYLEMTLQLAGADEALRARVNTLLQRLR